MAFICEELLSENDFEAVSATFCCYDHGTNASSEELQVLQMLLVRYNLLNSQNIPINQ